MVVVVYWIEHSVLDCVGVSILLGSGIDCLRLGV